MPRAWSSPSQPFLIRASRTGRHGCTSSCLAPGGRALLTDRIAPDLISSYTLVRPSPHASATSSTVSRNFSTATPSGVPCGDRAFTVTEMGFTWSRQTVAHTERGIQRRASFEEIFGLAALFGVPAASILTPPADHGIDLNARWQMDGMAARELFLGRGGVCGEGGPGWRVAARECSAVTMRPAGALARRDQGRG